MELTIESKAELKNGYEIPYLGLGTWRLDEGKETKDAVKWAIEYGYRHIDTAQYYKNEQSVSEAITEIGLPRSDIFVTTKVAISNFGYDQTIRSVKDSIDRMEFEYIDQCLLHFPVDQLRIESYKALEKLYEEGLCKSIGVSNFTIEHLEELIEETDLVPAVNQVEFHPYLYQQELLEYCVKNGIQLVAYSPLTKGERLDDPNLIEIAEKYSKSTAQILIRWALQHNVVVIPKSSNKERIQENSQVYDFEISDEDMEKLDKFNEDYRTSWDPSDPQQVKDFSKSVINKVTNLLK